MDVFIRYFTFTLDKYKYCLPEQTSFLRLNRVFNKVLIPYTYTLHTYILKVVPIVPRSPTLPIWAYK